MNSIEKRNKLINLSIILILVSFIVILGFTIYLIQNPEWIGEFFAKALKGFNSIT